MRKSLVAGLLVVCMAGGGSGVAAAAGPEPVAATGSSDTGSAGLDALLVGVVFGAFIGNQMLCGLVGSGVGPCMTGPIG